MSAPVELAAPGVGGLARVDAERFDAGTVGCDQGAVPSDAVGLREGPALAGNPDRDLAGLPALGPARLEHEPIASGTNPGR